MISSGIIKYSHQCSVIIYGSFFKSGMPLLSCMITVFKNTEVMGDVPDFVNLGGGEIRSNMSQCGGKEQGDSSSK